uniref:Uncharacterized protein n=1 Tax=Rhipicephalus appendiculatus TaxID=34631 RepID=A0A131YHW0_RHIAP
MNNSCFNILAICIASILLLLELQECPAFVRGPFGGRKICRPPTGPNKKCMSGTRRPTPPPYRPVPPYRPPPRPPGRKLRPPIDKTESRRVLIKSLT